MNKKTHVFFACQRFSSGFLALLLGVLLNIMMIPNKAHGTVFKSTYLNDVISECVPSDLASSFGEASDEAGDVAVISASVRHETVKRGTHQSEMEPGEYVVASSFKSPDNAKHFASGLRNLEFNARYGYLSEKDLWYVYILKTTDPKKARAELARVSAMFLLRDAWMITVQP